MKTFAQFIATRQHIATDIATAYGQPWDEIGCNTPETGGYLYVGEDDDTYYIVDNDGEYSFMFEHDDYAHDTLEAAEAALYANVYYDAPESRQFWEMRCTFGEYDDVLPIVPGFVDDSYGNDAMPKLTLAIGDYIADLYCDYRNYESREMPSGPQFALTVGDEDFYERVHKEFFDVIPAGLAHKVLTMILGDWCARQGLKCESADEMILRDDLTVAQRTFISDFITAWESAE
ncbi:hypothetical protein CPT_Silvanus_064 [Stenotrophomonas phage Silvanus]|nr:hypothetical protein CPT_Silvanus_064 [Stenotrophomonas phage Silvanus]